jgi:hypothetical protein
MAAANDGKRMKVGDVELNYWHYLAMFFAAVTIVAALGEWVFHWWADPGQYVAAGGFVLTLLALGFGANKHDLHRLEGRVADRAGQREIRDGQRDIVDGQRRLVEGQQRLVDGQQRLIDGQAEQTRLLEQVVLSSRQGPQG